MSAAEIKQVTERVFGRKADHSIKYVFTVNPVVASGVRVLTGNDYKEYESLWCKCHPETKDIGWLKEYFDEMAQEHVCIGVYGDGMLVSCTDAPGVPYMEKEVCEIGINTLAEYRGRGYASVACRRCIGEILCRGKVPLWSADICNRASRGLAEKVGFAELGEVITIKSF